MCKCSHHLWSDSCLFFALIFSAAAGCVSSMATSSKLRNDLKMPLVGAAVVLSIVSFGFAILTRYLNRVETMVRLNIKKSEEKVELNQHKENNVDISDAKIEKIGNWKGFTNKYFLSDFALAVSLVAVGMSGFFAGFFVRDDQRESDAVIASLTLIMGLVCAFVTRIHNRIQTLDRLDVLFLASNNKNSVYLASATSYVDPDEVKKIRSWHP